MKMEMLAITKHSRVELRPVRGKVHEMFIDRCWVAKVAFLGDGDVAVVEGWLSAEEERLLRQQYPIKFES